MRALLGIDDGAGRRGTRGAGAPSRRAAGIVEDSTASGLSRSHPARPQARYLRRGPLSDPYGPGHGAAAGTRVDFRLHGGAFFYRFVRTGKRCGPFWRRARLIGEPRPCERCPHTGGAIGVAPAHYREHHGGIRRDGKPMCAYRCAVSPAILHVALTRGTEWRPAGREGAQHPARARPDRRILASSPGDPGAIASH